MVWASGGGCPSPVEFVFELTELFLSKQCFNIDSLTKASMRTTRDSFSLDLAPTLNMDLTSHVDRKPNGYLQITSL